MSVWKIGFYFLIINLLNVEKFLVGWKSWKWNVWYVEKIWIRIICEIRFYIKILERSDNVFEVRDII